MSKRSFESINYMLRPNKNVERKLIASTLLRIQAEFSIRDYRYVGFGSMWFSDFILMHKIVGISDMVTIEGEISRSKRVEFNKPFGCINVKMGKAETVLGDVIDEKNSVVWLDYDGPLKSALTGDLEIAIGAMSPGSIFLVSVNAMVDQLKGHIVDESPLSPAEYLAEICDSDSMLSQASRLTRNDFPSLVAEILHDRVKATILSLKPGCEYQPIWTFSYADEAQMLTIGGMIVDKSSAERLARTNVFDLPYASRDAIFEVSIPVLTEKEKRALDRHLPSENKILAKNLDFELKQKEIDAYQAFYLEYPVFNELVA
ncbi:O-methyltransferase [Robbsia sp. KACC 23696]|uniref:O-methyltransferase n=1 Tax=Robbsia sp. KACC 23696 TaxID=3149231 RepID=UPI00325AC1B5